MSGDFGPSAQACNATVHRDVLCGDEAGLVWGQKPRGSECEKKQVDITKNIKNTYKILQSPVISENIQSQTTLRKVSVEGSDKRVSN